MNTYTIKLGTEFPAYGEVEIEAASPNEAQEQFLDDPRGFDIDWIVDWLIKNHDIRIDAITWDDFEISNEPLIATANDVEANNWVASAQLHGRT